MNNFKILQIICDPYLYHMYYIETQRLFTFEELIQDPDTGRKMVCIKCPLIVLDGSVPLLWGTAAECHLVLSDDVETMKKGCGKSFAPFPEGCFFTSSRGLRSYEYPLNELKPVLRVDSSVMCEV
ncbi:unnamed protein product [Eruca vesicaria subsp. sativa]|uniref:DUF3700 domain-containing protein n=1 Tax=Eruca vesicaria subsp. sativa TaxID=29727 RepID=A0ABC8KTQ4_ERUVS|nr:unnamed protein product [Eruca vesicaria subsp. sativa]